MDTHARDPLQQSAPKFCTWFGCLNYVFTVLVCVSFSFIVAKIRKYKLKNECAIEKSTCIIVKVGNKDPMRFVLVQLRNFHDSCRDSKIVDLRVVLTRSIKNNLSQHMHAQDPVLLAGNKQYNSGG